jgi:MFS family permease
VEPPIEPNSSILSITRRYYLMRWIDAIGPSFVLVNNVLFMQARGLSQFEMNCWAATYFAVAFASDVPMGAFADAMGRRVAYVLGCTLGVASFLIYFLAHQYWIFLLAALIGGVGDMMRNGAVDAWAVDAIASTGFSGSLDRVFSRASQVMQFGGMLAVLLGGYSARIDIAIPWLLGAIGQSGMAMAAVSFMRGENRVGHSLHPQAVALRVRERLVDAIQAALANRIVLTLALANAITMAAWAPFWFEWPQYFNAAFNRGAQMAAWVYCLTSIATMLGAEFIARRQPDPSGRPVFMSFVVGLQSDGPQRDSARALPWFNRMRRNLDAGLHGLVQRAHRGVASRHFAVVPEHLRAPGCRNRFAGGRKDRRRLRLRHHLADRGRARAARGAVLRDAQRPGRARAHRRSGSRRITRTDVPSGPFSPSWRSPCLRRERRPRREQRRSPRS